MQRELNRAFADVLKCQRVVPVLTVADGEAGVALARALAEGGLRMIEVTLRTAGAIEILRRMAGVPGVIVGAGTVMTPAQADAVIAAGARFIVSPGATPALVAAARGWSVPYLPGVATAGEAMALGAEGYHALKFFPAEAAGGVAVLKALAAPLQDIVFCPTGGIDAAKAPAYLALSNVVAVGGSWVAPEKLIAKGAWSEITALAREAAELAGSKDLPLMAAPELPPPDGAVAAPAAADEPAETSLMQRLRRLTDPIRDLYVNAAHIQELSDLPAFREAVGLLSDGDTHLDIVVEYACGDSAELSCVALAALVQRPDADRAAARVAECVSGMDRWQLRFAIELVGRADPVPLDALLARFRDWWVEDARIALAFNELFTRLGERAPQATGPAVKCLSALEQARLKELLSRIRHPAADVLAAGLKSAPPLDPLTNQPLRSVLDTTGRFWGDLADPPGLFEPADWKSDLAAAEAVLRRQPPRSLLLNGEPLAGKTSFLRLLAQRLAKSGWRVYEAGGADLQAGLPYIGQLEGRLRQLLEEIAVANRVIWYVPDLLQLALSGTHQAQSASILDQIMPALAEGRIVLLTEATPTSFARLMQLRPALRRIVEVIRLQPLDREPAIKLAGQLAAELGRAAKLKVDGDFPAAAVEAAEHYLSSSALPGSALSLVRLSVLKAESSTDRHLRAHSALETLAQMTGLPLSILDGSERLDMEKLRAFFTARVIGQPEAVESVVERVAMLKAGLNDPMKPIAVFLLAGPTGTGKTELAKALSEYLFGSIDRMIRLDMSEYQAADALTKIVGGPALPADVETLASRIRKQPFSLVLLDEFEKSAPQVWDLFLQVFDEGRLTDAQGQTADFRHSIIILTTNLGATRHQSSGLGFAPSRGVFTPDQVMAAVGQTFRPEFQNRLDKVIVFQPLTRELMRGILKKELDRLFQRRGLKARDWAIEWEASALEFLLEKGFTPEMGARPLKRAIDQYVVAPLAQTIVERRFPEGDQFVFMRSDGTSIRAEFVDPDGDGSAYVPAAPKSGATAGQEPTLPGMVLNARGNAAEIAALEDMAGCIEARVASPEWTSRKASLGAAMNAPDFWTRADRAKPLAEFALMDRLEMAADTASSLRSRLVRRRSGAGQGARELVGRLALQCHLLHEGLRDLDEASPVEVALAVEPAFESSTGDRQAGAEWSRRIAAMYRGWARERNMQMVELDGGPVQGPVAIYSGFGAYRRLSLEAGLHVLEGGENGAGRAAARVLAVPVPPGEMPRQRLRVLLGETFAAVPRTGTVVRRYRLGASPLVRNADGSWRSGKVDAVLAGNFDLLAMDT